MGKLNNKTINREMFNQPLEEVEGFIKAKKEQELSLNHFATLPAIKGNQFNREIFSSMLKFKDLLKFLEVFPEVQRTVNKRNVARIKRYVLTGLNDDESKIMRFFSAITVTCRGGMFYDESTYRVAINTHDSRLSVNDGQHRLYGISEAIRELSSKVNTEKDENVREELVNKLLTLKNMVIPLVIYNHIDESTEKQLFHDLNNLASRPSRSATINLAQTDLFSKMAREISTENRYLNHYGVEMEKMSIHGDKNTNTVLLTTVYSMIKILLGRGGKSTNTVTHFLNEDNYDLHKKAVMEKLDKIFSVLPHDLDNREKYILSRSYTLKGIMKFYNEAIEVHKVSEEDVLKVIENGTYSHDIEHWKQYGASLSPSGKLLMNSHLGVKAVYDSLMKKLHIPAYDLFSTVE